MMEFLVQQSLAMAVVPECLVMLVAPEWLGPQPYCAAGVCRCKTVDDVLGHCRF